MANKESPTQQRKVKKVMHEFKAGKLKGGKGKHPKVKSRKQAIAIALSEARVKPRPGDTRAKKSTPKSSPRKTTKTKATAIKRPTTKRATTKRTTARKATARRAGAKKTTRRQPAKRTKRR